MRITDNGPYFRNSLPERKRILSEILYLHLERTLSESLPFASGYCVFFLFENGYGSQLIDEAEYEIKPKQLHILYPGQFHGLKIRSSASVHLLLISKYLMSYVEDILGYSEELFRKNPVIQLSKVGFGQVLIEFKNIRDEIKDMNGEREIMFSRLKILALLINKEASKVMPFDITVYLNPILKEFKDLVYSHYRTERQVKFYARKLGITPNYLNVLVRKHFGITATSFIYKEVINEIKRQLLTSKKRIPEIVMEMRFSDLSTFSTFFKVHAGCSPRAFIAKMKEKRDII
ncbi:MAG: helix-turn-helix domain-containing protein [Sphingobacterium sp.]|jgi:AraC-like DNA-binding protein|nr:helix-turn-helix domain-containing protein [Sphingobacterium sp.]